MESPHKTWEPNMCVCVCVCVCVWLRDLTHEPIISEHTPERLLIACVCVCVCVRVCVCVCVCVCERERSNRGTNHLRAH